MKNLRLLTTLCLALTTVGGMSQTLEQCQQAAEQNYPLIERYGLIDRSEQMGVKSARRGWLPGLTASAQATLQSDVVAWPDEMQTMIRQMGIDLKGLKKDQYRLGIDVSQTIYDGGAISSRTELARSEGRLSRAQTETELYQVRQRVSELFFRLLMLDEEIQLGTDLCELLSANEKKLQAMLRGGTASESDWQAMRAERLSAASRLKSLQLQRQTAARVLSLLCGMEVNSPVRPTPLKRATGPALRPELKVIDARIALNRAQEKALLSTAKPKLGLFAQGFYGYPGLNMFEDMLRHDFSPGGIVGARLTWNIGSLYTLGSDRARLAAQRQMYDVERDVFLFNNRLTELQQSEGIDTYRQQTEADAEIVQLRRGVRLAAESKLEHGVIAVSDLIREINAENAAQVEQSVHELQMLKEMYDLKITLNN